LRGEVVAANGDKKVIVRNRREACGFDAEASEPYVLTAGIMSDSWDQWNDDQERAGGAGRMRNRATSRVSNQRARTMAGLISMSTETGIRFQDAGVVLAAFRRRPPTLILMHSDRGAWYPSVGYTWGIWLPLGVGTPFHCGGWSHFEGFRLGVAAGYLLWVWATGLHYRRPPAGIQAAAAADSGPPTVIRLKHPVLPRTPGASR